MNSPELVQLMKKRAEAVQACVSVVKGFDDIAAYTADLTKKQGGKTIAATGLDAAEYEILGLICESAGLTLLAPPFRNHARNIHTSLTVAGWGIADTGSLVIDSSSEDVRIATMLPETHIAILPAEKIKPDPEALAGELDRILKADTPAYMAFITGASRTADIERVLAIGVHGPRELHILIVEDHHA
ncbi:MAG: lactate utilization protein [Deltaproteobacteria bacterium]|nr:MAG: lactate utilization protein [Deltaproteobacteria bacterium]RUA00160.1 MAG: lactate utilization protein [Deltaproteobacteria bacterium]